MKPVEKMAARVLARHKLSPPYDLEQLVKIYGTVEYLHIPFEADGITVGIGGDTKPQIIINDTAPETRKKFTLAHELGHIIIPWHTGTIVSHIDPVNSNFEYKEMEAEANLFAAELLVPRSWILDIQDSFPSIENLVKHVLISTGVSRDVALIKIFNTIEHPIICSQIDSVGTIIYSYRTKSAPTGAYLIGRNSYLENIFSTAEETDFTLGDRSYKCWSFSNSEIIETDSRPWRDVLNQILEETDSLNLLPNINSILPAKYNANKDKTESELCALALQAYDGRKRFEKVISHPLFPQYVIKRIRELIAKRKK